MRAAMVFVLSVALVLSAALALDAVELVPCFTGTPTADQLCEWELRDVPPAWLVTDVQRTPVLTITDPQGQRWQRAAFLFQSAKRNVDPAVEGDYVAAGPALLRLRHTPRLPGDHTWTLSAPDGSPLASGTVSVAPALRPTGAVRISPHNPRLLALADGTPWIPIGPNIAWGLGPDRLANIDTYFAHLAEHGGTHARIWLASWCGQFEGATPDAYDLPAASLTDAILSSARKHGLHLTVVIDNHHDLVHGKRFPYGPDYISRARRFLTAEPPAQYRRKLRYLLARWGADDTVAVWELFNEVDMACLVREISIPWMNGATRLFHDLDQDDRLVTISWAGLDWPRAYADAHVDIVQLRGYVHEWLDIDEELRERDRDGVGMLIPAALQARELGRPFFFGETGYQGLEQHNPGNTVDTHGFLLRQQAWAGFLLGGCGSGMNWWWDVYIDANGLWDIYGGLAKAIAEMDWRDPDLAPLAPTTDGHIRVIGWQSPQQALLWPQIRIDTWYKHVVEQQQRPEFSRPVDLPLSGFEPSVRFHARWQHQVTAQVVAEENVLADANGNVHLTMPADGSDLIVLIQRLSETAP